jgi:hypothetical protein
MQRPPTVEYRVKLNASIFLTGYVLCVFVFTLVANNLGNESDAKICETKQSETNRSF